MPGLAISATKFCCPNPLCPQLSKTGGFYNEGRSWSLHLSKSPSCNQYQALQRAQTTEAEREDVEIGDTGPQLERHEHEDVMIQDERSGAAEGMGIAGSGHGSGSGWFVEHDIHAGQRGPYEGTPWDQQKEAEVDPGNPFFPFADSSEFEMAYWLIESGLPKKWIDSFLKLDRVSRL